MKDIEVEIKNKFYRPARRSIDIYRETLKAMHDKLDKAAAPSKKRLTKFWSLLVTVSVLSAVAQCNA